MPMWRTKFSHSLIHSARRRHPDCHAGSVARGLSRGQHPLQHPDRVKRCYALSGIYDMRDSMDGMYDDNFYFNNPVDYMANQNDPWFLHQYGSCDIRLVTGTGPWENSGPTYDMSRCSRAAGLLIISTTGARRAGTNGLTGTTRCGNTWARTSKDRRARRRGVA